MKLARDSGKLVVLLSSRCYERERVRERWAERQEMNFTVNVGKWGEHHMHTSNNAIPHVPWNFYMK